MSCGCQPPSCAPLNLCPPENYGGMFPTLIGPQGPPGGPGAFAENYALLRAFDPSLFVAGYVVYVAGYSTVGDRGGGLFQYKPSSTDADNDGTIIAPTVGTGRWYRMFVGPLAVSWFGAPGRGLVDESDAIQRTITVAKTTTKSVFLPYGTYNCATGITLPTGATEWGIQIFGEKCETMYEFLPGAYSTRLKATAAITLLSSAGAYYTKVSNLLLDGNSLATIGYSNGFQDTVSEVTIAHCAVGLDLNALTNNTKIDQCALVANATGLRSTGSNTTTFYVTNSSIRENTTVGAYIEQARGARFSNTTFESNAGNAVTLKNVSGSTTIWDVVFDATCYFEGNTGYAVETNSGGAGVPRSIEIRRPWLNNGTKCFNFQTGEDILVDHPEFFGSPTTAGYFVVESALRVVVTGNDTLLAPGNLSITGTNAADVTKFMDTASGFQVTRMLVARGTPTNDNAPAGYVGEVKTDGKALAAKVALTTAVISNIASVVLTPGDWDVSGAVFFNQGAGTTITALLAYLSTTSGGGGDYLNSASTAYGCSANVDGQLCLHPFRVKVAAGTTQTIYLTALGYFAVSTLFAYGVINARRMR